MRSTPLHNSDTPRVGFEPAQSISLTPFNEILGSDHHRRPMQNPCQTINMEHFTKIDNRLKRLTIFVKCPILYILQGSEYLSDHSLHDSETSQILTE